MPRNKSSYEVELESTVASLRLDLREQRGKTIKLAALVLRQRPAGPMDEDEAERLSETLRRAAVEATSRDGA